MFYIRFDISKDNLLTSFLSNPENARMLNSSQKYEQMQKNRERKRVFPTFCQLPGRFDDLTSSPRCLMPTFQNGYFNGYSTVYFRLLYGISLVQVGQLFPIRGLFLKLLIEIHRN